MKTIPKAERWIDQCSTWTKKREIDAFALGALMRQFRESAGKGLRETATAMGITPPYLSDCERGFRKLDAGRLQQFIDFCAS